MTLNGELTRWAKIAIEIAIILFAIGIAWATLKGRVDVNCISITETKSEIREYKTEANARIGRVEQTVVEIDKNLAKIGTRQELVIKGIDEIKNKIEK